MCIAIVKPEGKTVPRNHLSASFCSNPDGAGMAYPDNGKMKIVKGYFDFESFYADYLDIERTGVPMLIHFRISTAGLINDENCHPFRINKHLALIHNGILNHRSTDKSSDTRLWVQDVIQPMVKANYKVWQCPHIKNLIEGFLGKSNAVAIMHTNGTFQIFNEKGRGHVGGWEDGIWYSNDSYLDHWGYYADLERGWAKRYRTPAKVRSSFTGQEDRDAIISALYHCGYSPDELQDMPNLDLLEEYEFNYGIDFYSDPRQEAYFINEEGYGWDDDINETDEYKYQEEQIEAAIRDTSDAQDSEIPF